MLDLIRRSGNLNRSTVQAKQMIDGKRNELAVSLGRTAKAEEVAAALNLSMEAFYSWTKLFEANVSESLSQAYDEYSMVFAAPSIEPERRLDSQNLRVELVNALKMLSKQQSMVMQPYYVEDLNTYEIAAVLDLSPGRVSQIKSEAFKALQSKLQNYSDLD